MKKLLVYLVMSASCLLGQEISLRPLSQSRIAAKQKKIQQKLELHGKIQTDLIVAGLGMTTLSVYKMLRELFAATEIIHWTKQVHQQTTFAQKASGFAKGLAIFGAETAGAIIVTNVLNKFIGDIMHENSLTWYITTQEPVTQTIELMEEISDQYEKALTQEDSNRHKNRLIKVTNLLIPQLESIIAFMQYKTHVDPQKSALKHEVSITLQDRISSFISQMSNAMADSAKLSSIIAQFKLDLNHDLIRFAYCDQAAS